MRQSNFWIVSFLLADNIIKRISQVKISSEYVKIRYCIADTEPTDYISKLDGYFDEKGVLNFNADYVTQTQNPLFYVAVYKDGVLKGCKTDKSGILATADGYGTYKLKAFLWHSNMEPICEVEFKDIVYADYKNF